MSYGYQEIRAFTNEDYTVTVTVENGPVNISSWTLVGHLWNPQGVEIVGAVVITITNPTAGVFTVVIAGQSLTGTAYYAPYRYEVVRTDAGSRTVILWGTLEIVDPSTQPND